MTLTRFFRRGKWDDERRRELEAYLAIETDANTARGMPPDEARLAALRKLGNRTVVREEIYQMNTLPLVDTLWRDLRYGARLLRLNPGFAVVAILSLALGIGANTAIFQLLHAVEFRLLPVSAPEQLVEIRPTLESRFGNMTGRAGRSTVTYAIWQQIRGRQEAFSSVTAWGTAKFDLATSGESRLVDGLWVSGEFFSTLDVPPALGRVFTAADDVRGCGARGVVISDAFWRREYGGDRMVVGKTIQLDKHRFEIIGVTPAGFSGIEVGRSFDVAVPLCSEPTIAPADNAVDKPHYWWLDVIARLKPAWSVERATAHLGAISPGVFAASVSPAFPANVANKFLAGRLLAYPAGTGVSYLRREYEQPLWMLLAVAGLVLFIACANLANLMLARATAREREIAVRLAIGASRSQLVRQLLAESLVLAALGALGGAVLARFFTRFVVMLISTPAAPLVFNLDTNWPALAFMCALAACACAVFGLLPAVRATRQSAAAAMKAGGRGTTETRERFGVRRVLVVVQVALSLVLIVGALLFAQTVRNLASEDPGFRTDNILVADFDVRSAGVRPLAQSAFQKRLRDRLTSIPGVDAAVDVAIEPVSGSGWNDHVLIDGVLQEALPYENRVSPGFFSELGIPFVAGRDFDDRDVPGAPMVAIVNEAFAQKILGTRDAIGRTFRLRVPPGEPDPTFEIVGVVRNTKYQDVRDAFGPLAYYPEAQETNPDDVLTNVQVLLRARVPVEQLTPSVTAAAREISPGTLVRYRTLEQDIRRSFQRERMMAILSGFFGVLGALIAMIGLYGVISYSVARRRNEIGVRMALGAAGSTVRRMIMADAALLLLVGLAAGAVLSLAAGRFAGALLFGLRPNDPSTIALSAALLATVATLASYVPAWRASRLSPTIALREE
jgi:putative ABC transport system permease protein